MRPRTQCAPERKGARSRRVVIVAPNVPCPGILEISIDARLSGGSFRPRNSRRIWARHRATPIRCAMTDAQDKFDSAVIAPKTLSSFPPRRCGFIAREGSAPWPRVRSAAQLGLYRPWIAFAAAVSCRDRGDFGHGILADFVWRSASTSLPMAARWRAPLPAMAREM